MNITVFGSKGRMGTLLSERARQLGHCVYGIDKDQTADFSRPCDVVIDFSVPEALDDALDYCTQKGCPLVYAVTGLNEKQKELLRQHSERLPTVYRQNFGEAFEAFKKCVVQTAELLPDWDCVIYEAHKKNKKDRPSGTALVIQSAIESKLHCMGINKKIEVLSARLGEMSGMHSVIFAKGSESVTMQYRTENSTAFASGALRCAVQLVQTANSNG